MAHATDPETYVGRPMKRREDRRLLLGAGKFVDDLRPAACLSVIFVRSPHGHARIVRLGVDAARKAPGVVDVIVGDDVRDLGPMPVNRGHPGHEGPAASDRRGRASCTRSASRSPSSWPRARPRRGTPPTLLDVEYAELPAVAEPEAALASGAPVLYPDIDGNRSFRRAVKGGDPDAAFARAAHRVSLRVAQEKICRPSRWSRAWSSRASTPIAGELTVWVSCQSPFRVRGEIARLLGLHESQVRVIAPDVGGGFGVKTGPYREEVLLAWLAVRLERPVAWASTRREDFETTNQARGSVCESELALDADGRILGLRARIVSPLGASLMFAAAAARRGTTCAACPAPTSCRAVTSPSRARSPTRRRCPPTAAPGGPRRASSSSG